MVTRQASTPSGPSSEPWPDQRTPPNGESPVLSAPPLIPTIPQKTLLVFGDDEYAVPRAKVDEYRRLIPDNDVITIENTRLYPHYEAADRVNAHTVRFLRGN